MKSKKIILRKFSLSASAFVLCLALALGTILYKEEIKNAVSVSLKSYNKCDTVIIDAGHGGFDGGAVAGDGTVEKNINLKIALKIKEMLKLNGINVVMTRETDTGTNDTDGKPYKKKVSDLNNRLRLMKKYKNSVFVSVHLNKFTTSSATGAQVFYSPNLKDSEKLGSLVQKSIVSGLQPLNTRAIKRATSSTFLLYNATVPAILVECGFLSNKDELNKLKTDKYQSQMAFAISCGIINYL